MILICKTFAEKCFSRFQNPNCFDRIRLGTARCVVIPVNLRGVLTFWEAKGRVAGDKPPVLCPCLHYPHIYWQPYQHLAAPWLFWFSYLMLIFPNCPSLLTDLQHTTTVLSLSVCNCILMSLADFPYSLLLLIPLLISLVFCTVQFLSSKNPVFIWISH